MNLSFLGLTQESIFLIKLDTGLRRYDNNPSPRSYMNKTLYLIDGSGFIFRAYFAIKRDMTNPAGVPVKAVYGFVTMIQKLLDEKVSTPLPNPQQEEPSASDLSSEALSAAPCKSQETFTGAKEETYIAVIFDAARKTFRNDIYPEYKAHRPPPPEDLIPQFALVRDATKALNLPAIDKPNYEADDIIATYTMQARQQGMNVVVVSSDKDLMQLIQPGTIMYDAMKDRELGIDAVIEKFGVKPDKLLDVLSLMGDSSDNVPGVPGIGPKTAAELINEYGDLDGLLAHASEIKQNKRRETIIENEDMALLSKKLITLHTKVPDLPPLESLIMREPDGKLLLSFLQEHGFRSLVTKAEKKFGITAPTPTNEDVATSQPQEIPADYSTIRDAETLRQWVNAARKKGVVAFDTETTSLNAMQAELVGFSLCMEPGKACYVPLTHVPEIGEEPSASEAAPHVRSEATQRGQRKEPLQGSLFGSDNDNVETEKTLVDGQIPMQQAIEIITPLLEDTSVLKIGHNMKYDWLIMQHHDVDVSPIEDTMLLSYALHAGEHGQGMDELAQRYLGITTTAYSEVTGKGKKRLRFDEVEIQKASHYAAQDADITLRLYHRFKPELLDKKLLTLYETIERPFIPVIVRMEQAGILVDTAQLQNLSTDFAARMEEYVKEIHKEAGHEFNVGSPKQLGEVLFEEMQLPGGKKSTKTGAYSTDSSVLEDLAAGGQIIAQNVIAWRQLSKLKSTYSDALAQQINSKTGRVHTSYALAITSTGRLSSSNPNLQNIPIRSAEGRKIREAFVAKEGYVLMSADYSQIELRLLAHMADIDVLKTAFRNGDDIHAITASQMFGVPVDQVDSELRRQAKTINFGIIYGISAHGLSVRLGISRSDAAAYIEQYFTQYPGIRKYMERTKEFAREHGYVTTLYGRRCHVPGINDKNGTRRQFSERAAINAPLQGTAADIIKRAMIDVDREMSSCRLTQSAAQDLDSAQSLSASQNDSNGGIQMLLQVHDELVFEIKKDKLEQLIPLIKNAMENAASLSVPLIVECGHGAHWNEAH